MAKRVRLGSLYKITDNLPATYNGYTVIDGTETDLLSVFEWIDGFQPGDVVQVVNPPGGRTGGQLRHVCRLTDKHIGFCNIQYLEPYRAVTA